MLHLLRRAVRPDGRLVFSAFLNDPDDPPVLAKILEERLASADPAVVSEAQAAIERVAAQKDRGFLDVVPEKPLLQARYDLDFALELIDGTGWRVESVNPPEEHIQHYLICRPAGRSRLAVGWLARLTPTGR